MPRFVKEFLLEMFFSLSKCFQWNNVCVLCVPYSFTSQGVKPASFSKVAMPEIKEIIGECICHRWEER